MLKILKKTVKNPIENCEKSYRELLKILKKTVKNLKENR